MLICSSIKWLEGRIYTPSARRKILGIAYMLYVLRSEKARIEVAEGLPGLLLNGQKAQSRVERVRSGGRPTLSGGLIVLMSRGVRWPPGVGPTKLSRGSLQLRAILTQQCSSTPHGLTTSILDRSVLPETTIPILLLQKHLRGFHLYTRIYGQYVAVS